MRSQSCPFEVKNLHSSIKIKEVEESECNPSSISELKKKKKNRSSLSQNSLENNTVIIK